MIISSRLAGFPLQQRHRAPSLPHAPDGRPSMPVTGHFPEAMSNPYRRRKLETVFGFAAERRKRRL
jgi:hypothetical protein